MAFYAHNFMADSTPDLTMSESDCSQYRKAGLYFFNQSKDPHQKQNLLPLAINAYIQDMELNDSFETLVQLAKAYVLNGQFQHAKTYLEKASIHPHCDTKALKEVFETKAFIAFREGDVVQTEQLLKKVLGFDLPWKQSKAHFALAGIALDQLNQKFSVSRSIGFVWHMAYGSVTHFFSNAVSSVWPYAAMGLTLAAGKLASPQTQLNRLLKLQQKYPGLEILPVEIGNLYLYQDDYSSAEYWYRKAIERHPSRDEGYRGLVMLYQNLFCIEELIEVLNQWLALRPNHAEILFALSQAYGSQPEKLIEATQIAQQALLNTTDSSLMATLYSHLGHLYTQLQQHESAAVAYQASVHAEPDRFENLIQLGTLYYDRQQFALSQQTFLKALALSPQNAKIYCNLGYLAWMQGDIETAQAHYHKSISLDPSYDIALNNLGVLYLDHIGNMQKAMALFDQTLLHNPNYALCYYNKGRAYSFLGENIEAAKCFQKAQELNVVSHELDQRELTERIQDLFESRPLRAQRPD